MGAALLRALAVATALAAAAARAGWGQGAAVACERCHGNREFLARAARDPRTTDSLVVTRAGLRGPHAAVACARCHGGVTAFPHAGPRSREVACASCHAREDSLWRDGVHGPARTGAPRATCAACHGSHAPPTAGFGRTAVARAAMRAACMRCHAEQVRRAARDVHADSVACTDCHGDHAMRPVPDDATRRIDIALARACSRCHRDEGASYWRDIHGRTAMRQAGDPQPILADTGATCVSCHGEHGIRRTHDPAWRFAVADACMRCHVEYGATFRDSYHGQASRVGSTKAAECADCHTAHAVLPASDSASSVSPARRPATCRRCHTEARGGFAGYLPHADPTSPTGSPLLFTVWLFMNVVLFGTILVWGSHAALWYARSSLERRRRAGQEGAGSLAVPMDAAQRGPGPYVWRFNVIFRVIHLMIVATFFLLVATGLPLRFSCTAWAPLLMRLLGGAETAGLIHRVTGLFVFGYFALYGAYVAVRLVRAPSKRELVLGPNSILFRRQDLADAVAMVQYFFGRGPHPRFGRFSYMEKFDYFAELWGVGVIGFTGLMLWFPEFFARLFPGILFNVAIIVHSYEAMIATAFIFTIHFFNVHLRPGKWPLDGVMFTGRGTLHYMHEEHPLVAEAIAGRLIGVEPSRRAVADLPAPPPPRWLRLTTAAVALPLLGIGLALIGLILWGSLC